MSNHAATFWRLRMRLFRNARTQLFGNSRTRLVTMIASSLVVWLAVYGAAHGGFHLLNSQKIPSGAIVDLIFNAMFFTLGTMLVFSTGLVLYASLFNGAVRAEEREDFAVRNRKVQVLDGDFGAVALRHLLEFNHRRVPAKIRIGELMTCREYLYARKESRGEDFPVGRVDATRLAN